MDRKAFPVWSRGRCECTCMNYYAYSYGYGSGYAAPPGKCNCCNASIRVISFLAATNAACQLPLGIGCNSPFVNNYVPIWTDLVGESLTLFKPTHEGNTCPDYCVEGGGIDWEEQHTWVGCDTFPFRKLDCSVNPATGAQCPPCNGVVQVVARLACVRRVVAADDIQHSWSLDVWVGGANSQRCSTNSCESVFWVNCAPGGIAAGAIGGYKCGLVTTPECPANPCTGVVLDATSGGMGFEGQPGINRVLVV